MRVLPRAVVLALTVAVLPVASATAGLGEPLQCLQPMTNSGPTGEPVHFVGDRGTLRLNTGPDATPTSYEFDVEHPSGGGGGWTRQGDEITFQEGPLGGQGTTTTASGTFPADEVRMPNDPVQGRTFPLVLTVQGEFAGQWYCGRAGFVPRELLGSRIARIERTTGFRVRLPLFMRPVTAWSSRGSDAQGFAARVLMARRGEWRFQFGHRPCSKQACDTLGWVQARKLNGIRPWDARPGQGRVTLADGGFGSFNIPGCGPGGWGGVICGWETLQWHRAGVEYALQWPGAVGDDLVRWANQMLTAG